MNRPWLIYIILPFYFGLLLSSCVSDSKTNTLFTAVNPQHSNIHFNNIIEETDSFNMYEFMNIYTGGGVAVGDIDNNGLEDIFFSGNNVASKLYLNKGNLEFEDITEKAGIKTDRWCAGASMADINSDGLMDIYVSVSGSGSDDQKKNLLYINNGDLSFKESAASYGLDDSAQIMHSSFFDYDNDGDLDVYMIVNPVDYTMSDVNNIKPRSLKGESQSTDKLYRNNGDQSFTNVSSQSGILIEGYSLGVATSDINNDGWIDIYISNDFLTNDILYINNGDGTFTNKASEYLDHTSFAGMGSDIADVNNDGKLDIMVVDMLPEDNYRRKMIIPGTSYDRFKLTVETGYDRQYTRNTLQLNNGNGSFSEIGQLAGIDQTDWSWSSLFADYDNDGDKDLLITNGFLRDVGNLDYISYQRENNSPFGSKKEQYANRLKEIQKLGDVKIPNYIYENNSDLTFTKRVNDWGIDRPSCSNGAAFSDLDNDGDLDLVINNVNDKAFLYENNSNVFSQNNFLKINLKGKAPNLNGIGAKVTIHTSEGMQFYQHSVYRGYESTVSQMIHFGLGDASVVDSLRVHWPDGTVQFQKNINSNQTIELIQNEAIVNQKVNSTDSHLFENINEKIRLDYIHQENDFADFKVQALLPHKHSQSGPGMAVGDVNGDELDDIYIGGSADFPGQLFLQRKLGDGTFQLEKSNQLFDSSYEDMGSLFVDVDSDGDKDLIIVSGGSSSPPGKGRYQDRVYINDGSGNFERNSTALPILETSGSCIVSADYDQDGDMDLFIGGRVIPGSYPLTPKSQLLRNDSEGNQITFTEVPSFDSNLGMITSALWTDYDNDGWKDLMLVGEFMPLTFIKNDHGVLQEKVVIKNSNGWWNSISPGDFDADGDTDYMIGNLGLNTRYNASPTEPLCIYANDYDKNGRIDPVMCYYINGENYISHPRNKIIQQINAMRSRFKSHEDYASTPFEKSFLKAEIDAAEIFQCQTFAHSYIKNNGNGNFTITELPIESQIAPIYGMKTTDVNSDGHLDVITVGNSYATETSIGNYDAGKGMIFLGNGDGNFDLSAGYENGFFADQDGKGLAELSMASRPVYVVSNNNGPSISFGLKDNMTLNHVKLKDNDSYIDITYKDGRKEKRELYHGQGYLSQSSRILNIDDNMEYIIVSDIHGETRSLLNPLKISQ